MVYKHLNNRIVFWALKFYFSSEITSGVPLKKSIFSYAHLFFFVELLLLAFSGQTVSFMG